MTRKPLLKFVVLAVLGAASLVVAGAWFLRPRPVEVVRAAEGTLPEIVHGPGKVESAIPITVGSRITAVVTQVTVDEGAVVQRGQLLARLDERDVAARVAASQAMLERGRAQLRLAESIERRDRSVQDYLSEAAVEATAAEVAVRRAEVASLEQDLRYAQTQLSFTRIEAPTNGVIVARLAEPGETVAPGSPIVRMVDPSTLQVVARIDETVVGRVEQGQPTSIRLRSGETLPGRVSRISLESDAATRELEVEVAFDRPPERFAIDQEAEVEIHVGDAAGIVVPESALVRQDGRAGVLLVRDGRARFQPLEIGAWADGRIIATKGLHPEDVLVRLPQDVRSGERVRAVEGH